MGNALIQVALGGGTVPGGTEDVVLRDVIQWAWFNSWMR